MAFTVDIRGNASHLEKTLKGVKASVSSLGSIATGAAAGLATIGAAGAAGLTAFVISSSKAASSIESLTMQFETLLGSEDAAGKRMAEIVKFAASTPFEIAELAATSKQLQNAGGDVLAIGDGLRMVGDAAAISGRPLEEVALHIGRVFGAMTSGTSAGESVGRLVEIGLITGDVKREFEALAAAQKKGAIATYTGEQALAKMQSVLSKTEGAMGRLAATTEGKLSNVKDNITQLQVAFGTGFNEGLKGALDATNTFLPQLTSKFTATGEYIGNAIQQSIAGNHDMFAALGEAIGDVFLAGLKASVITGLDNLGASLGSGIANAFENAPGLGMMQLLPENVRKYGGNEIREFTRGQTNFKEQFSSAMQSGGANQSVLNVQIQRQIAEGIKTGITSSMSDEVKKGVLEAWQAQSTGAKFSN